MSIEGRVFENELMRAALDAARIGLCVADAGGRIVVLGGDFAEKLDTRADALITHDSMELLVPGLVLPRAREVLSLDAPEISVEATMTRAGGAVSILLFQARTIVHDNDERFRIVTLIDVTDFGVTRDRYIELRRQLDALNSALVVSDARRDDMPIVYVNRRFEEMTGYSAAEVVGRNCRFLQGSLRDQPELARLREAYIRHTSCHVVLDNFRKDGSPFRNELFVSPVFDDSGEVTHYIGMQREFAERTMAVGGAVPAPDAQS